MSSSPLSTRRPAIRGLDIHVGAVIVLGMIAIASSLHAIITNPPPLNALLFAALGLVAGACAVKIPGLSALVSASDTFFIASAMLAGPGAAMVAMAIDSTAQHLRRKKGMGVRRLLFNATAPSLSLWAGAQVFQFMGGHAYASGASSETTTVIIPLVALTVVYFGFNSSLIAQAISLDTGAPFVKVWRRLWPLAVNHVAAASAAFCFVIVMRSAGALAAGAVAPLVVVLHLTLRSILGRLADAEQHVQKIDLLYLSTIETLATAIEAKDGVTSDHIRRVQ